MITEKQIIDILEMREENIDGGTTLGIHCVNYGNVAKAILKLVNTHRIHPTEEKKRMSRFEFAILEAADPEDAKNYIPYTEQEEFQQRKENIANQYNKIYNSLKKISMKKFIEVPDEAIIKAVNNAVAPSPPQEEPFSSILKKGIEQADEIIGILNSKKNKPEEQDIEVKEGKCNCKKDECCSGCRSYKYFIEDTDTHEWYTYPFDLIPTTHSSQTGWDKPEPQNQAFWTKDPEEAFSYFKDKEAAEKFLQAMIDRNDLNICKGETGFEKRNLIITEHEFPPSLSEEQINKMAEERYPIIPVDVSEMSEDKFEQHAYEQKQRRFAFIAGYTAKQI